MQVRPSQGPRSASSPRTWSNPQSAGGHLETTHIICENAVISAAGGELEIHTAGHSGWLELPEERDHRYTLIYRNLIAAVEGSEALVTDHVDGLRSAEVLDAMLRSQASGRMEEVHSIAVEREDVHGE